MKKVLHLMIAILLAISAMGQPVDIKTRINAFQKPLNFENIYGIPPRGDKHKMQNPKLMKTPIDNQLKSASEGSQKLDSVIYEVWDSSASQWVNWEKGEFALDANGNYTLWIYYYWNDSTSQWVGSTKGESALDANGNNTLEIAWNWDVTTNQWVGGGKLEHTYDANGNNTLYIDYNWDVNTSQWVVNITVENTYDANGNDTLSMDCGWYVSTLPWYSCTKWEITYDANGNVSLWINYNWDVTNSPWVRYSKGTYYYSENNITFIPKIPEKHISVYPNPAADFIVFDLTNISESAIAEIFDIQGKKVLEQKLSENKQLSVRNLSKGLYMYKLNNNGIIYTGKLLKE